MASTEDVKKLAALARLSIPEEELARFAKEFESILTYISQIDGLKVGKDAKPVPLQRNVFREDGEPHEKGKHTEALVKQFPDKEGNALKVRQVISHD